MAQNITLLGASYSAVPKVRLPKTGGGTADFTDVTDTTATASDVASGKYFYTADGTKTQGTSSGGGGTSKNVQIAQSTSRATSSTYTKVCGDITVSKTGTYDVYWDCFRSTTSGTTGSQFYIGSTAQGTANTTFTNHVQTNHLSNVSLTANQKVSVYARSRGNNYYAYVGQLVIIES
jgi:hypothetical protein